ncbi:hypothetical protein BYT27DRAFT_6823715 [Phlegmacium glaucopus]|nr:hypothetical protein BYT27DRAFT_6823715 [Phlegmacium glaucopus]
MDRLGQFAKEATRVSQEVGTEGSHSQRRRYMARIDGGSQLLGANTTSLVRSIVKVTKAFALGDLSKQIEVDARDEIRSHEYCQYNDYERWRRKSLESLYNSEVKAN